jgi:hypothetical protein
MASRWGGRKSYNPKNKGKKSYQPILTFLAETREYLAGGLRNGDRPTGKEVAEHLRQAFRALPACVQQIFARADSGFYCWEAVAAYLERGCQFVIVARKTARLLDLLHAAQWKPSPQTDADAQCEFTYQPDGWEKAFRFVALRYEQPPQPADEVEQYQLFATGKYTYRVFVTDMPEPIHLVVAFYNGRAGGREPDQGSEQRCRAGGASLGTIRYEPQLLSDGDAGLQLELLADAVQPRRAGRGGHLAAHYAGHGAVAVSVRGGEDLESCRANRCELQRSLRRKRAVRKAHGSVARHHAAGQQLRARAGGGC